MTRRTGIVPLAPVALASVLVAAPGLAQDATDVPGHVTAMLHAIDARDWEAVRAAFADEVFVDYTSLNGGEPGVQLADDLVGGWRAMLPGFDATQHLTGPFVTSVEDGIATTVTAVTATHRLGAPDGPVWIVGGHYDLELEAGDGDGLRITSMTLRTAYVRGDTSLPERARARASGD